MRVRVIASRISAMIPDRRSNAPSTVDFARRFAQAAGKFVAREHHVGHAAHHAVEQFDRKADRARRRATLPCASATVRGDWRDRRLRRPARARRSARCRRRPDSSSPASIAAIISPMRSMIASTALTSAASAWRRPARTVGERILGGMAERFEPREVEEAAIALDRVDEAEDANRAARGRRARLPRRRSRRPALRAFPGIRRRNRQSDRPSVARAPRMISCRAPLCRQGVNGALSLSGASGRSG